MGKNKVGICLGSLYLLAIIGVAYGGHYTYLKTMALPLNPVLLLAADYAQVHSSAFEFLSMVVSIIFNAVALFLLGGVLAWRND